MDSVTINDRLMYLMVPLNSISRVVGEGLEM